MSSLSSSNIISPEDQQLDQLRDLMEAQLCDLANEIGTGPHEDINDATSSPTIEQLAKAYKCNDLNRSIPTSSGSRTLKQVFESLLQEMPDMVRINNINCLSKNFKLKNGNDCTLYFAIGRSPFGSIFYQNHTTGFKGDFCELFDGYIHLRFIDMNLMANPEAIFILPEGAISIIENKDANVNK